MSEIDFQNGLVVGLTLAGKNGAVGGVAPPPSGGGGCGFEVVTLPTYPALSVLTFSPALAISDVIEWPA